MENCTGNDEQEPGQKYQITGRPAENIAYDQEEGASCYQRHSDGVILPLG